MKKKSSSKLPKSTRILQVRQDRDLQYTINMSSLDPDVVSAEEFQAIILGHGRWRIVYTCLRIAIAARTSRSVVLIGERRGRCC